MHALNTIDPQTFRALNLEVDDEGFLIDSASWTEDIARQIAEAAGLGPLQSAHWMLIGYLRNKYFTLGALPPMRNLCRQLGVQREVVKQAFGSCRTMWQIAGLPNPGEEARSYMS